MRGKERRKEQPTAHTAPTPLEPAPAASSPPPWPPPPHPPSPAQSAAPHSRSTPSLRELIHPRKRRPIRMLQLPRPVLNRQRGPRKARVVSERSDPIPLRVRQNLQIIQRAAAPPPPAERPFPPALPLIAVREREVRVLEREGSFSSSSFRPITIVSVADFT